MVSFVYKLFFVFFLFILSYFFIQYFQLNAVNGLDAKPTAMNKTIFKKNQLFMVALYIFVFTCSEGSAHIFVFHAQKVLRI